IEETLIRSLIIKSGEGGFFFWLECASSSRAVAARHSKSTDSSRVVRCVFFHIVADVPDRAVIARVYGRLRIVLPSHNVLRACALHQDSFPKRQLSRRVLCKPPRKALAREVW